ncbi:hypothetical protein B0H14DRAFT_2614794 [Mycena olivaceomarginata]|nr:hypothetical protein B0H14DRAFT_2614794 [Mycena olivaceomarginata]
MLDTVDLPERFECSRCHQRKTLAEFKVTEKGGRARTCLMCQRQAREGARKRKAGKENTEPNSDSDNDELNVLGVLGLEDFLNVLTQQDDNLELDARVEISSLSGNGREKADQLVVLIWKRMKYRFVYHSKYDRIKSDCTRFMYHCSEWIRLESVTTREDADEKYITRVDRWTCTCKAQAMHSCHLCKHLVQSLPHPPAKFWMEVVRRRTLPLYCHPALVIPGSQWIEPADGSITDGDDHGLRTRSNVLAGGGGWRELDFSTPSLLGKRARPVIPEVDGSSSDDAAEVQRMFFPSFNGEHSDNEEEIDGYSVHLLKRAEESERAAAIFRAQVPHRNRIWMSSMVKQDVGRDVGNLVKDIHRYESSSRVRDTTWARKKGDKEEQCRIKNTMGYQVSLGP